MLSRGVRELARRCLPVLVEPRHTVSLHTEAAHIYSERIASAKAASGPTPDTGTICVVHGLLGVGRNLATLTRTLVAVAERQTGRPWQAVLLDQRCHGKSGQLGLPPPHTLAASAEDILRLFRDGLEYADAPDVLVGHSLGGKVCLELTARMARLGNPPSQARGSAGVLVLHGRVARRGLNGREQRYGSLHHPYRAMPRAHPSLCTLLADLGAGLLAIPGK